MREFRPFNRAANYCTLNRDAKILRLNSAAKPLRVNRAGSIKGAKGVISYKFPGRRVAFLRYIQNGYVSFGFCPLVLCLYETRNSYVIFSATRFLKSPKVVVL